MIIQKPLFDETGTVQRAIPSVDKGRSYNGDYMALGKIAEDVVMRFLRQRPDVIGVDDLRKLQVMHEADVDVCIRLVDGRVTLAEIKYDSHLGVSPNLLFEVLRVNHTSPPDRCATLGWAVRSPATWLLYYAPATKTIYRVRLSEFQKRVQRFTDDQRKRNGRSLPTWISWVSTDNIKSTLNFLIPMDICKDIFMTYDVSDMLTE